jgi:four helix bundle suffix protein
MSPSYPEIVANGVLALIAVACSLLERQLSSLAAAFEKEGGFTERLYRVRSVRRSIASIPSDEKPRC